MKPIYLGILFAIVSLANTALADAPVRHPSCPDHDPSVTWKDYVSGNVPRPKKWKLEGNVFGVDLRSAAQYADPAAIGNLNPKACYMVMFVTKDRAHKKMPAGFWTNMSSRNSKTRVLNRKTVKGASGNPQEYELNVNGVTLLYGEHGEVFDFKGRLVGQMSCVVRDRDC